MVFEKNIDNKNNWCRLNRKGRRLPAPESVNSLIGNRLDTHIIANLVYSVSSVLLNILINRRLERKDDGGLMFYEYSGARSFIQRQNESTKPRPTVICSLSKVACDLKPRAIVSLRADNDGRCEGQYREG